MAGEILIIGDVIDLNNGKLAISVGYGSMEKREEVSRMTHEEVKDSLVGKNVRFEGEGYSFQSKILNVKSSTSISNFKNIFIQIAKSTKTDKIKERDEAQLL